MRARSLAPLLLVAALLSPAQAETHSLDDVADRLAARISKALSTGKITGQRLDVAITVRGRDDGHMTAMAEVVERSLIARLRRDRPHESVATLEQQSVAGAAARGFERWVDIKLAIKGTQVVFISQVFITADDVWRSVLGLSTRGGIVSAFQTSVPLTPEIRMFLDAGSSGTLPSKVVSHPLRFQPARIAFDPGAPVLAMRSADIDVDGTVELLVLTEGELIIARIDGQTVLIKERFALEGKMPLPHPRNHVGTLLVTGGASPSVLAQTSTHQQPLRVRLVGEQLRSVPVHRLPAGAPAASFSNCSFTDAVTVQTHTCSMSNIAGTYLFTDFALQPTWPQLPVSLSKNIVAVAGLALAHGDGSVAPIIAASKPNGELLLFRGPVAQQEAPLAAWSSVSDVGRAVAMSDLDGDGALEVITTAFLPVGDGDRITVTRIHTDGSVHVLYQTDQILGGVVAVAAGDFDGQGAREIVGFARVPGQTNGELWIIR